ncbi:MAG: uroporphyrinogen decarboxylase family protein [Planctomycetota bacterium]
MTRPVAARSENALRKLRRLRQALHHEEPDRVPISDFFWGGFIRRWREELGLGADVTPHDYYDLDWIVTIPNMDPWVRSFEIVKETQDEVLLRTGYGAVMRKIFRFPMPEFVDWDIKSLEKLEAAEFDDPRDPRRFFSAGDNQIAGVGDGFERNSPPWIDTVQSLWPKIPVYASMGECSECLTRLIGPEHHLLWIAMEPERMGAVINRIGEFYLECAKAAIDAALPWLDGLVIWGDVAYKRGTFMRPDYWRTYYKPWVRRMVDYAHSHGLDVIYHGCGNVLQIFEDYIEIGVDAYNPLEAKAGMDVLELRRRFGHRMAFCGNSDIQVWERGDRDEIAREVLRKLNAARGGGMIFQSDHSVSSSVSGATYDYIVGLVREFGRYPLQLGKFDEPV